ncbi:MAG: ferritin-like domain-containing protein [Anaerolineae bacterium]|jgi:rubrerythrin
MALLTGDELIEIAVRLEERGEAFYNTAADRTDTAETKALFEELAIQEQYHRRAFQQMGREMPQLALSDEQWEQFQAYADVLLEQRVFDKPGGALAEAAQAEDETEALRAALGFEKETLQFYRELRGVIRGADQQTVDRIIGEEEHHIQRLSGMLATR